MILVGDTVAVVDPEDEYHGQEGRVIGVEVGLLSGREMAVVQLEGRPRWDMESFYLEQVEVESRSNVVPLHQHSIRV